MNETILKAPTGGAKFYRATPLGLGEIAETVIRPLAWPNIVLRLWRGEEKR